MLAQDGQVFETRLTEGRLEGWRHVGVLPGEVSVADGVDGPTLVGLTRDLRVHRSWVDGDRVVVEALGPVLPRGARASATLDRQDPERMLVAARGADDAPGEASTLEASLYEARRSREAQQRPTPALLDLGFA